MEHRIKIVSKVIDKNNNVVWYNDSNGIRYTREQIQYIIINKKLPMALAFSRYSNDEYVQINMKQTSNGLISTAGTLKRLNMIQSKTSIVIEDSKSGFTFYKYMIEAMYENVKFDIVTVGNGNKYFRSFLSNQLDFKSSQNFILIVDSKEDDLNYEHNLREAISLARKSKREIWVFKPVCVEEVIFSSKYIKLRNNGNKLLHDIIIKYLNTGEKYFTFTSSDYRIKQIGVVDNLEKFLSIELNKSSALSYTKRNISCCFFNQCCTRYDGGYIRNWCAQPISGVNCYTGDRSLMAGLQNIIDQVLGKEESYLCNWKLDQKKSLYSKY